MQCINACTYASEVGWSLKGSCHAADFIATAIVQCELVAIVMKLQRGAGLKSSNVSVDRAAGSLSASVAYIDLIELSQDVPVANPFRKFCWSMNDALKDRLCRG